MRPTVLTVAGSDSSGGAGIQADLKAIEANGAYAATVVTAVTAQNTRGVTRAEALPAGLVRDQLDAVFADLAVRAVKSGMLATAEIVQELAAVLERHAELPFVCDPVMLAKGGHPLLDDAAAAALSERLLPRCTLLTPNVHEAARLTGRPIADVEGAIAAGEALLARGARAVLVTGGHLPDRPGTDVLVSREGIERFEGPHVRTRHTHGTGCTYAAAIAAQLARGRGLVEAVRRAKRFVAAAIRHGLPVGAGHGPTDPFFFLYHDEPAEGWGGPAGPR